MELYAEFTFCLLDDRLIEESKAYQRLCAFYGREFADSFTCHELVPIIEPHPPPE